MESKDKKLKAYSFNEIKDEFIGENGTTEREQYEFELKIDILGEIIKKTRKERNLTQEQLGSLIGVQKAQISRLEKHAGNVQLATLLKVFNALKTKLKFQVQIDDKNDFIIA
ncbi:MAG: helix-turn-helix transcriptional regulator [Bacteroidales bacterium]|nr:helix-turn-helix transcriptional regulator [Bacteroidales bacterium]